MNVPGEDRPPRDRLMAFAALGLFFAAVAFAFLYFGARETSPGEVGAYLSAEAVEVGSTAAEVARLLSNYSAQNIDQVGERLLELSTGRFREDYEVLLPDVGPALERAGAETRGEIIAGPEVSFRTESEAIALVTVEQTTTTRARPQGRQTTLQFQFVLTRGDEGGWRADRLAIRGN